MQLTINEDIQYIARISHGKDSLKMLDVIVSRGLPLDRITTTDVWATDTIRGEYPEMVKFKDWCDGYIWAKYRIEVEHLCAMKGGKKVTYESLFYHVPKRREYEGEYRQMPGTILGFPTKWGPWCQSDLKRAAKSGGKNIVEYLGIAADEPHRFGQLNERKRAPLVEFGIDEGLCGLHCQYEGILGPSYIDGTRDGCWMCHNQGVKQLRLLRKKHPELWKLLLKWDWDSPVTFKADGHTVHDYDLRFRLEYEKLIDPAAPFRWSMLDEELQYRLF